MIRELFFYGATKVFKHNPEQECYKRKVLDELSYYDNPNCNYNTTFNKEEKKIIRQIADEYGIYDQY